MAKEECPAQEGEISFKDKLRSAMTINRGMVLIKLAYSIMCLGELEKIIERECCLMHLMHFRGAHALSLPHSASTGLGPYH